MQECNASLIFYIYLPTLLLVNMLTKNLGKLVPCRWRKQCILYALQILYLFSISSLCGILLSVFAKMSCEILSLNFIGEVFRFAIVFHKLGRLRETPWDERSICRCSRIYEKWIWHLISLGADISLLQQD